MKREGLLSNLVFNKSIVEADIEPRDPVCRGDSYGGQQPSVWRQSRLMKREGLLSSLVFIKSIVESYVEPRDPVCRGDSYGGQQSSVWGRGSVQFNHRYSP